MINLFTQFIFDSSIASLYTFILYFNSHLLFTNINLYILANTPLIIQQYIIKQFFALMKRFLCLQWHLQRSWKSLLCHAPDGIQVRLYPALFLQKFHQWVLHQNPTIPTERQ